MDRRSLLASSTLLLAVIVLLRLQGLFHGPVDVDETDLSTIAQMVRDGAVLYADVAEKKPPLGYLFYVPFAPLGWALVMGYSSTGASRSIHQPPAHPSSSSTATITLRREFMQILYARRAGFVQEAGAGVGAGGATAVKVRRAS